MSDPTGMQPPYFDPSQYPAFLDAQRQQQLAQMLMGAFQQSNETPQSWNSMRVVPRRSPLANVATLATALMAGKAQNSAFDAQNKYFQGLYGGGQQPQSTQGAPTGPGPGIISPDAPPDTGAPPPGNLPQATQAPPQNPMLPPGMTPQQAQMMANLPGGGPELTKAMMARFMPLDIQRQLDAAGIPANSPVARDYIQRHLLKENYIAPTPARPNTALIDDEGKIKFYNPGVPEGSMPQFGADGRPTSIVPIPGGEEASARASAGKTAGTVSQTPQEVGVDDKGRKVFVYPTPPALSGGGGAAPAGAPRAASSGGGQTASEATLEAQKQGAQAGQTYASELSKNATGATEVRRSLSEMRNLAAQSSPGAANESKMKLGAVLIAAGMDTGTASKMLGVDPGVLQAAAKQNATLAVNSIHAMTSRGTNFDLDTFIRNNPNLNMADPGAFNRVVDYMDNKARQEIAKQKDFAQWKKGVSPDDWETGHTAHWLDQQNQNIDKGQSNSPNPNAPKASLAELQAEARKRGLIK